VTAPDVISNVFKVRVRSENVGLLSLVEGGGGNGCWGWVIIICYAYGRGFRLVVRAKGSHAGDLSSILGKDGLTGLYIFG
jgi:hypothetical protein